ncbi:hypothetical protein [Psychromarinibacter sp. S121]|uniref:hypothetical protein n=1 Tax=Psychromarinibacter sp. S121 TaxID=3415127 RepID=UPI003C7C3ABF
MQMLCRIAFEDFDRWKSAFDDDAERRGQAGLTVLQIWRETGTTDTAWVLFGVNDPKKARAYADGLRTDLMEGRAGVTTSETHMLDTL